MTRPGTDAEHPDPPPPTPVPGRWATSRRVARRVGGLRSAMAKLMAALATSALVVAAVLSDPRTAAAVEVLPYEIEVGDVATSREDFVRSVEATLDDPRGWTLGDAIDFRHVAADGLFTVVLASSAEVERAAPICSAEWSCRVGDRVLINEDRWLGGTVSYPPPLADYRDYVVNHEVGHWLGLAHRECPGYDDEAPVMMQQSIAVGRCRPTVWPVPDEQQTVGEIRNVDVRRQQRLARGDRGAGVAEWQQHLDEQAGQDLVVDGWFGPATESATLDYERFFGLPVDGVAGAPDRSLMNYLLRLDPRSLAEGMRGPDVTDWQRELRQLGLDLGVDGWFGPQTRSRTLDLQRFFGFPATGEADATTRDLVDFLLSAEE